MKRLLVYGPAAQRKLTAMDRSEAERRYRLRVGKWRIFFTLDQPNRIAVIDLDNRGQAY